MAICVIIYLGRFVAYLQIMQEAEAHANHLPVREIDGVY
jgi:hypothetical protein